MCCRHTRGERVYTRVFNASVANALIWNQCTKQKGLLTLSAIREEKQGERRSENEKDEEKERERKRFTHRKGTRIIGESNRKTNPCIYCLSLEHPNQQNTLFVVVPVHFVKFPFSVCSYKCFLNNK